MRLFADLLARLLEKPFPRLVAHFASVIIQTGQESGASELNLSLGGVLAILAVPGGFMSILLFDKYSSLLAWLRRMPALDPYLISLPDKYFFIVFSMVITGVVTVLKWDRILPSRQDYANLAPLPLGHQRIFLANLAAILLLASIFAVDVNAASALLFPVVVLASKGDLSQVVSFIGVHAVCVILASAFTFFGCFAIMGALMSCLPQRAFRRASLVARLILMTVLIAGLCTSFAVTPLLQRLPRNPHSLVRFLPSVWYLGLYQSLQGKAGPELAALGGIGLQAAGAAFILALAFGFLSYRRSFQRIPESADSPQTVHRKPLRLLSSVLDRFLLTSPFERACYHFSLRALVRSETHCILFGAFLGLGLVTGSQSALSLPAVAAASQSLPALPAPDLLAVPLCFAYFLIIGLRFAFDVPAGLDANWIFRLILNHGKDEAKHTARKLLASLLVPGVILPTLLAYSYFWGLRTGLLHTLFVLGLSALLGEIVLLRFRKIPFTCSLPGFQNNAIMLLLVYILGFWMFTTPVTYWERWMLANPVRFLGPPVFLAIAWCLLQAIRDEAEEIGDHLIYHAEAAREVTTLDLVGHS